MIRDHQPITISEFNGLYARGEAYQVPLDHFSDCQNLRFVGSNSIASRYGIGIHQNVVAPLGSVVRIYNYITAGGSTLLVLTWDGTTGKIYHVVDTTTVYGPILSIAGMEDFAFAALNGRAFLSPFKTFTAGSLKYQKGLQSEFVYVYLGAGAAARKAAGAAVAGTLTVAAGTGTTDLGIHVYAVVGETDTGYLSPPFAFKDFINTGAGVSFSNVPVFIGSQWVKRHIVSTIKLDTYNGDSANQTYFFIPGATINDNVTAVLNNVSFYDADLVEDASYLLDNYTEIPAGAALGLYKNRLCVGGTYTDISLILVSAAGEPEAISQVDGLLVYPLDGNPITNIQEYRDILYAFKRNKTGSWADNGDVPSTWNFVVVDSAIGCGVHGVATVVDSGAPSIDFLIIATYKGITLFNGTYVLPELSWKIRDFWLLQDRNLFNVIHIVYEPISQIIYCVMTDGRMIIGDYSNGLDPLKIRWCPFKANINIRAVTIVNVDQLIIGADKALA